MTTIVGVFDSGVGGLTVVRELRRLLPRQPIVYFGDTARTPYGTKSAETLIQYARENTEFLLDHGAGVVVIACHSAASCATAAVRERFPVPVFEVVTPSVDQAVARTRGSVIGLIGTRATVASGVYEREILARWPGARVHSQACPLLVPLVEEGWLRASVTRMTVKKYLGPLKARKIDTLILGCTHYPLLAGIIREKIGKRVEIVDPSAEVATAVREYLRQEGSLAGAGDALNGNRFYLTDLTPTTQEVVQRFLGERVSIQKAALSCKH